MGIVTVSPGHDSTSSSTSLTIVFVQEVETLRSSTRIEFPMASTPLGMLYSRVLLDATR